MLWHEPLFTQHDSGRKSQSDRRQAFVSFTERVFFDKCFNQFHYSKNNILKDLKLLQLQKIYVLIRQAETPVIL